MEAFSLLKYWRGGGIAVNGGGCGEDGNYNSRATTIVSAVSPDRVETDDENDDDGGPFFDLEFAVPDEEEEEGAESKDEIKENNGAGSDEENDAADTSGDDDDGMDEEREFNFTLSSASSNDRRDQNLALSPSDDLFFKGRLVPIESSSLELNSKSSQFSVSLLKSATKFRVFMSGLKRKPNTTTTNEKTEANVPTLASAAPKQQGEKDEENGKQSKLFTVKFKVEEVPIMSFFTRENSKNIKSSQQKQNSAEESTASAADAAFSDDKQKFSKDVMQKYLKKVKPLYIRVSKRYGEKLKFSGQLSFGSGPKTSAPPSPSTVAQKPITTDNGGKEKESAEAPTVAVSSMKGPKQGNLPAGLRVVCKHLGKSRSASSAAAAHPVPVLSNRRDDSLLQQQDGIQSAILHCKRSFNASRDSDSSVLSRSASDPSHEKSLEIMARKASDHEGKGSSVDPKRAGK
ncbi:PREDICTED: probable membrane-associated kinase regulator 2 [Populus euphratica]|uniref:Probable membrane-associated kinase regulator 2 n=1 Tax=Populus euphratica TaxID=75702 RepID=A0AAJ6XL19_POPEU|nr:PREDICTED: probable membrane-associated kinase regulator 2 [Populus euphratica]